jgi:hypothetical protein
MKLLALAEKGKTYRNYNRGQGISKHDQGSFD